MLERLHWLAGKLAWVQPLAVVVGGFALVSSGYIVIDQGSSNEQFLVPAILLFSWSLLAYTLIELFSNPPPTIDETTGFIRRQIIRLHRGLQTIVATGFLGLSVALIVLTYKLLVTGIG